MVIDNLAPQGEGGDYVASFDGYSRRLTARDSPLKKWWLEEDALNRLGFGHFSGVNSLLNFGGPNCMRVPCSNMTSFKLHLFLNRSYQNVQRFRLLSSVKNMKTRVAAE